MALDGIFLHRLLEETAPLLRDGKINKIHQPDKNRITMKLNTKENGNFTLVLSVHPNEGRINITEKKYENPTDPGMFVMVLRKHLENGRIIDISQKGYDRVAELTIESRDEIGDWHKKHLYLEIMGKHSNLILTDENDVIIAAIKPYGANVSRYRKVLPHEPYITPPPSHKLNPALVTEEEFIAKLMELSESTLLYKGLVQIIDGMSTPTAKELLYRNNISFDTTIDTCGLYEYGSLFDSLGKLLQVQAKPAVTDKDFYFLPLTHKEKDPVYADTLNKLLDTYFGDKEENHLFQSKKSSLLKEVAQKRDKLERKIKKQEQEYQAAADGEIYRIKGEILSANMYRVEKGMTEITLEDFYNNNEAISITLSPDLSPSANAGRYFKKYTKAKTAKGSIAAQLTTNKEELVYLNSLCFSIEECTTLPLLTEIRKEAVSAGYVKNKDPKGKKVKEKNPPTLGPLKTQIGEFTVLIGRNNKGNDKLTLRIADKNDIWLHTKDIPGSHVIIRKGQNKTIPDEVIAKAAQYAAFHSKAKSADKVPVDYTEVSQVKKPNGAKPGMVIYFEQTTLFVTPKEPTYINNKTEK